MIGTLTGVLCELNPPELILDVQGVGYEVMAPMNTIYQLPLVGQVVKLHIYQVVREDANLLFGFLAQQDKAMFKLLLKVNGIGPKIALAILSAQTTQEIIDNVLAENSRALSAVPGIGKKTAERVIIELRDKVEKLFNQQEKSQVVLARSQPKQEAISGLVSLGYKVTEAQKVVQSVYQDELSSSDLIRLALKKGLKA
jgi:Holliday junction DNA helicase RuvA